MGGDIDMREIEGEFVFKMADPLYRQKALVRVCEAMAWAASPDDVYQQVVGVVADIAECDSAVLFLLAVEGDTFVQRASSAFGEAGARTFTVRQVPVAVGRIRKIMEGGVPVIMDYDRPHPEDWIPRELADSGTKLSVNVPVVACGEVLGLCAISYLQPVVWNDVFTDFLVDVGRIVGMVVQRIDTTKKATALLLLDERKRISAEIHDTTSQVASALSLAAASVRVGHEKEADFGDYRSEIIEIERLARDLVGMLRDEMVSLRAPLEQMDGLVEGVRRSLESFERNWGIPTVLHTKVERDRLVVSMEASLQIMRILSECLSNVLKHSSASRVVVELTMDHKSLSLIVEDDGVGFDLGTVPTDRFGIRIMRERAALAGGTLSIISGSGGTSVCFDIVKR